MKKTTKAAQKVIKFGRFRWLAAFGIFGLIASLCFVVPSDSNGDQIYADNFAAPSDEISEEIDLMLSTRSGEDSEENKILRFIREGMEYYNSKEYDKAIPIFQRYLAEYPTASDFHQVKFYLAVSFLSNGETDRSVALLEELRENDDQVIQEDARWYLSLAYARTGANDKARTQLEALSDSERYGSKANKILNPNRTKVAFR